MQTLETLPVVDPTPTLKGRGRSPWALVTVAIVVVVATAAIAYAVGSSHTKTTTVVKTVPVVSKAASKAPAKAAAPTCIQGAAAGSCNIDEAKEATIPDKPLDPATRAVEAQQLVDARSAAMQYPTVADARRAGMIQAGQFSPETGAHFIKFSGYGTFDPSSPQSYIYDGISPTSKVIGVMYLSLSQNPPAGFAGPNDHWHRHTNTCVIYGAGGIQVPFPADSDVTVSQCAKVHGTFMRETAWMVHAWVVPGWESPLGVYSHSNPDVVCADGTTKADADGFCQGS